MSIFTSGMPITIGNIYSGEYKIVIPDLQRDYCWGNNAWDKDGKKSTELVSNFFDNLTDLFIEVKNDKSRTITLGLIYGYIEEEIKRVYLCDGQQRLTTIFLILGMINKKCKNSFKENLINTAEIEQNNYNPNLLYEIREDTLYFLSDLVLNFFCSEEDIDISCINEQDWYFDEYDLDPSIQSVLCSLSIINKKINDKFSDNEELKAFGQFLLENIEVIYYDLIDRAKGEETYVIINTTGVPLTATENLKPILIGNIENQEDIKQYSEEWEDREDWFWQNRGYDTTADDGMTQFFIWYWQIGLLQENSYKNKRQLEIDPRVCFEKEPDSNTVGDEEKPEVSRWREFKLLSNIQDYFSALKCFVELLKNSKFQIILSAISISQLNDFDSLRKNLSKEDSLFIVLPILCYLKKYVSYNAICFEDFIRRLRKNIYLKKRGMGNYVDWRHIIQIIEFSNTEEELLHFDIESKIDDFKRIPNISINQWYDNDELNKDKLKKEHREDIYQWEDYVYTQGNLSFIWKVIDTISFENAEKVWKNYISLMEVLNRNSVGNNYCLSNYMRVFLVLIGFYKIEHVYRCSGINGVSISKEYYKLLKNNDFLSVLNEPDLLNALKKKVVQKVISLDYKSDQSFDIKKFVSIWLVAKVIKAEEKNALLSFDVLNGVSLYTYRDGNRYLKNIPFSLGNFRCGYALQSGGGYESRIVYPEVQKEWEDESKLNSPIFPNIIPFDKYPKEGDNQIIKANSNKIIEMLDNFCSKYSS